ncbi:MAG TPA: hypothetical protein VM580_23600, partial [Labilithrix sp.]|nr:hypothetical protein [Labilithrix sp.]
MSSARSSTAFIAAVIVHALVVLGARQLRPPPRELPMTTGASEIAIEASLANEPSSSDPPAPPRRVVSPGRAVGATASSTTGAPASGEFGARAPGPAESVATESSSESSAWWFRPTQSDIGLVTRPAARIAMPEDVAAPDPGARRISSTGGLVESLDAADSARGLGRGGPERSAVDEAAHSDAAPVFGTALFAVKIGNDGSIDVDVSAASSDLAAWEGLRPLVRASLTKRPVRVPPNSRGLRVTVRVEASEQFPGGARPPPPKDQG